MKHLDQLLDELQEPIAQIMDWCDADKDRAIVACLRDLAIANDGTLWNAIQEAYPDESPDEIDSRDEDICDSLIMIDFTRDIYLKNPDGSSAIDYKALYQPLEHIINDRIEFYNAS